MRGETARCDEGVVDDLLNHAPCGFFSFSDDGTVVLANDTLLEMLGHDRDDVVGHHVERILALGSRIFYQTHWFPLLRMQGRSEEIFLLLRPRAGDDIGVLVNAVRRERDAGAAYDCALMHVRERRKYEDELLRMKREAEQAHAALEMRQVELERANELLESQAIELLQQQLLLQEHAEEAVRLRIAADEANAAKSTFLAMMSHELRTPLNAISGYGEILAMGIHGAVN
ncbi:MAG: histidine kinase dimerization/phospho-acceptor domain-containing protein, partial [Gemmatimonadota bacterium]